MPAPITTISAEVGSFSSLTTIWTVETSYFLG